MYAGEEMLDKTIKDLKTIKDNIDWEIDREAFTMLTPMLKIQAILDVLIEYLEDRNNE